MGSFPFHRFCHIRRNFIRERFSLSASYSLCLWRKSSGIHRLVSSGLNRAIEGKEISGSLACDGYVSAFSALLGCPPITSFSQNIGLVAMTKVVNRFTIMTGAVCMIMAGLQMLAKAEFNHRNTVIASLSLAVGIGFTSSSESGLWNAFPPLVQSVFASNIVAVVFVVSIVLNLILPKNMELQQ